jgi:hypothetical protein
LHLEDGDNRSIINFDDILKTTGHHFTEDDIFILIAVRISDLTKLLLYEGLSKESNPYFSLHPNLFDWQRSGF